MEASDVLAVSPILINQLEIAKAFKERFYSRYSLAREIAFLQEHDLGVCLQDLVIGTSQESIPKGNLTLQIRHRYQNRSLVLTWCPQA